MYQYSFQQHGLISSQSTMKRSLQKPSGRQECKIQKSISMHSAVFIGTVILWCVVWSVSQIQAKPTQLHLAFTGIPSEMSLMFVDGMNEHDVPYVVEYWIDDPNHSHYKAHRIVTAYAKPYSIHDSNKGGAAMYRKSVFEALGTGIPSNTRIVFSAGDERQSKRWNMVYERSVYEALLTGLPGNTRIAYRVGDGRHPGKWSKTHYFYTAMPSHGNSNSGISESDSDSRSIQYPFSFISYGDMDTTFSSMATRRHLLRVLSEDNSIRFIIHQGDIPYARSEDKWDTWFGLMENITAQYPYMVCPGNHEKRYNFTTYKHRFTNVTGFNSIGAEQLNRHSANLFYSWDYANIHFVSLSSEHDFNEGSPQYRWLESDLKRVNRSHTPFIIVYIHRPMYSSNRYHGSNLSLRRVLEPLLKQNGVDLVLCGHIHAYERTCAVFNGTCVRGASSSTSDIDTVIDPQATIHIHAGTAGYKLNHTWQKKPEWSAHR